MKKSILAIIVCLLAVGLTRAQVVVEDDFQHLRVRLSVGELKMEKAELDGRVFTQLNVEGMQPSAQVGAPNLPTWSAIIEVPVCDGFEVEVSDAVYDTLKQSNIKALTQSPVVPVQPSRSKSDREAHQLSMDESIYGTDAFFSAAPLAMVESVGVARDRNLARLQFSPVSYNPVRGLLVVCREATVTVRYTGSDEKASTELFERYHSSMFGVGQGTINSLYPKSVRATAPVRYLIVAHSMFRGQLDEFVNWKRRKGFITDIVYTDDPTVGTTSTSISDYVKSQYDNATATSPAPTYLLIVGDHEQIPAFSAQVTSPSSDHITDLYYASWTTGDHIPDCYIGRFSAQNVSQLTPQIEKTLMYEQYTFSDPSFLDRAVMVAGVDGGTSGDNGYRYGDPAMDYAVTNYVNGTHGFSQVKYFKNDVSIVPSATNVTVASSESSNSATVRSYYNQGAGWINYSAHGSATSWGTPSFTTSDAASMTNTQKFGIMIGNCCLTNRFQVETCLGESVLRKGNYCGAVGYIGGSNSTYWGEDFYWAVGVRSSIGPTMSMAYNSSNLGNYDRAFHTHNEAYADWATTQGSLVMFGNMAVESSTSSSNYKHYYWEIYHLMGDPSLMPYLTQAQQMTLTASSVLMLGANTLSVTAVPYAYVALTDTLTHTLCASGYANASGHVTLTLPSSLVVGGYELAASAQQYRTAFKAVSVVPASGPYPVVVGVTTSTPLNAGSTVPLRIAVANLGNGNASGVTLTLTSENPLLTLSTGTISLGSIAAGDTVVVTTVTMAASSQATDGTHGTVTASTQWSGSSSPTSYGASLTVNAALLTMTVTPSSTSVLPANNMTITVDIANIGHADLATSQIVLTTGNPLLLVNTSGSNFTMVQGGAIQWQFDLYADPTIDSNIFVPVYVNISGPHTIADTLQVYIGINTTETFEGGVFQLQGWTHGTYPWTLTSDESYEGSWSARSAANLGSSNGSEMSITFTVGMADSISFYYKVSSESGWDKFHCYLDNNEMVVESGEVDWTRAAFPVTAGNHLLLFSYLKDGSVDRGSDCAWIDNISLPHGTQTVPSDGGEGGDSDTTVLPMLPTAFENLVATFNNSSDDSRWTLVNGSLTNVWTIGTTGANGTGRGLYITNDGGQTNAYTINSPVAVFAYTTLWLDTGTYNASFDWRCNGESNYDYLRAALVPVSTSLTASTSVPDSWSTNTIPTGSIALDGGQKLNLSSTWQTKEAEIHVTQSGNYNLVFFWRNDNSVGSMPPAAIDNVRLMRSVRHTLTVTATHGTTVGSGVYLEGETATVGVFPETGYTFVGWNDGNMDNPRQLVVDATRTLAATLTQGDVVVLHDTTVVTQVITQTDTVTQTEYVPVHDTTIVTLRDTVTQTEYVPVHDTTIVAITDTVTLTEYIPVYDTTIVTQTDTVIQTELVTMHDTIIVTQTDTVTLTEYIPVYDTSLHPITDTVLLIDTVLLTEYLPVYDTVLLTITDTVIQTDTVTVYDTTVVTETITQTDTVLLLDTVTLTEYLQVHDTTILTSTDTITLTECIHIHDTTVVTMTDTVTLTEYIPIHDTTIVTLTDTVTQTEYIPIHDTTVVTLTDTVTLTEYIPMHDTTVVTLTDTVTQTEYIPIHDTTIVTDTVTLTEYIPIHDTTVLTLTDTVNLFFFDTTLLTDTLWLTLYDTLLLHDTIIIYDTIVIYDTIYLPQQGIDSIETLALKVYTSCGQIVVEGADGNMVTLYDVSGRVLATRRDQYAPLRFDPPASGTYMLKVGNHPARKVVVIR